MERTIAIVGGTGAMGRAVVNALLNDPVNDWSIRILTRDSQSPRAREMKSIAGDKLSYVVGDLNDQASLNHLMNGVYGAFSNTNFWTSGEKSVARERGHGLNVLRAAEEAGIQLFIHSSLDAANSLSNGKNPVPHYDAKASVEQEIDWRRSDEFFQQNETGWYSTNTAVLVTEPYFENFQSIFLPQQGVLSDGREGLIFAAPLAGDAPWPMVALEDIGEFARIMFSQAGKWGGQTLRIGSDAPTLASVVRSFEKVTGIPTEYRPPSDEEFLSSELPNAHDVLNNFLFYRNGHARVRDYEGLRAIHPELLSFESWLRRTNWKGEAADVQKDAISGD